MDLQAFLKDETESRTKFRDLMQKHRFVVFKCDDDTISNCPFLLTNSEDIAEYKSRGSQFFGLSSEEKLKFSSFYDTEKKQKVNRGYLVVDKVKEFLKVSTTITLKFQLSPSDQIPDQPPELKVAFDNVWKKLSHIAQKSFAEIAKTPNSIDPQIFEVQVLF